MKRLEATITKTEQVGDDIKIINFVADGLVCQAGQYITVYFDGSSTPSGKAYSLSSAPHEAEFQITVKRVGEFSGRLWDLVPGDMMSISEAYGHFNPHTDKPIVGLSAGVGIAPVWSMLKDELARDGQRLAHLFYTNKSYDSVSHHAAIETYRQAHEGFAVTHHITRSDRVPDSMKRGRIDLDKVIATVGDDVAYLVCGSVEFVRDMWQGLTQRGVAAAAISTEVFFE